MKKLYIIILVFIAIFAILIATGVGVFVTKINQPKTPITSSSFKIQLEEEGYILSDATYQFSDSDYIKQVYVAIDNDYTYQIEFYEFDNDSNAKSFYTLNKSIFLREKGTSSIESDVDISNYSKYTLTSNGKYMLLSRIDNTIVFVSTYDAYKDTINQIVKQLGY